MQNGSARTPGGDRHRHLPALSLALVVAAAVLLGWHFCPSAHRKRVSAFGKALRIVGKHYVEEVEEQTLFEAAMRGMIRGLEDPHSTYLNTNGLKRTEVQTQGEFGGIGVVIAPRKEGAIILEVQPASPAMNVGVQPGDIIVGVDGQDCAEMSFEELLDKVRGEVGTEVSVVLQRSGTDTKETLDITRALIVINSVSWSLPEPGIGYIEIKQFDRHTVDNLLDGLDALKAEGELEGLILDLRGNTGGLLDQAIGASDLFLAAGVIARLESRLSKELATFEAHPETAVPEAMPLAILVDWRSASAAEVFAGALRSHGRATLIGTKTFGKGAVNRVYHLPDDSGLILTVAHYTVGPDGTVIHGKGIEPDVKVGELPEQPASQEEWLEQYRAAREDQFERVLEWVKQKVE